jgi:hypothetical protein
VGKGKILELLVVLHLSLQTVKQDEKKNHSWFFDGTEPIPSGTVA